MELKENQSILPLRMPLASLLITVLLAMLGCGTEIGNPKKPVPTPVEGSLFLTDMTASSSLISSIFDEVAASGGELTEAAGSDTALNLAPEAEGFALVPKDEKGCEENADGTVTVKRDFNGNSEAESKRKRATFVASSSGTDVTSRTFSKPNTVLSCNGAKSNIRLGINAFFGMSVATTFTRAYEKSLTIKESGKVLWSKKFSANGSRNWELNRIDGLSDNQFGFSSSEKRSANRTQIVTKKSGESVEVSSEVGTLEGAPMVIRSVFERSGKALTSRVIESGTIFSVQPNDSRIETTFTNVSYTPSGGCAPVSGSIEGKIFAAGSTVPARTFTIAFVDDAAGADMQVKFDNGEVVSTQPEHCPAE